MKSQVKKLYKVQWNHHLMLKFQLLYCLASGLW